MASGLSCLGTGTWNLSRCGLPGSGGSTRPRPAGSAGACSTWKAHLLLCRQRSASCCRAAAPSTRNMPCTSESFSSGHTSFWPQSSACLLKHHSALKPSRSCHCCCNTPLATRCTPPRSRPSSAVPEALRQATCSRGGHHDTRQTRFKPAHLQRGWSSSIITDRVLRELASCTACFLQLVQEGQLRQ